MTARVATPARSKRAQGGQRGFTLIEVLIALAILAFMMAIAWGTLSQTASSKLQVEEVQERSHEIRVALERIVRDLEGAYLSSNEESSRLATGERRTYFVGQSKGSVDELRFSSLAHQIVWADANESEQTGIAYFAEADRKDRGKVNLLRRESRRLDNKPWDQIPGEVDVLVRSVEKVKFEYFDPRVREWKDSWDAVSPNGGGSATYPRLPFRVRITVQVKSKNGQSLRYTTQARLMLQDALNFLSQSGGPS